MTKTQLQNASKPPVASDNRLSFQKVMRTLLEPENERRRWLGIVQQLRDIKLDERSWNNPERHSATARRAIGIIRSTLPEIEAARDALSEAVRVPCSDAQLTLLLGGMVDGFPNSRPASVEGYLAGLQITLAMEIGDNDPLSKRSKVSAHVVAAAVAKAWRESRFPPSPAEMLAFCQSCRDSFDSVRIALRNVEDLREHAEEVLIVAGEMDDYSDGNGEGAQLLAQFKRVRAA